MSSKSTKSDVSLLELSRLAIETAKKHPEIKLALEDVGYAKEELGHGAELLANATNTFH